MGDPISLILWLAVLVVVIWLVFYILAQVPLPQPVRTVLTLLIALILLLYIVRRFGVL